MGFINKLARKALLITAALPYFFGFVALQFQPFIPVTATGLIAESIPVSSSVNSLQEFAENVKGGNAQSIRGVYAQDVFSLKVLQQPSGSPGYVSAMEGTVTQFRMAASNNITGMLAHNFASGRHFFDLQVEDVVDVVYGDGTIKEYQIIQIKRYKALSPKSATSEFLDLVTNEKISAAKLFGIVYTGDHHLTLQTCIQEGDEDSWGRLFIIAEPVEE